MLCPQAVIVCVIFLVSFLGPSVKAVECPPEKPKDPIPGCFGTPECAFQIADQDKGKCVPDHCLCDGTTAPLLAPTGSVSTINCGYSTQPASDIDLGTISGCVPDPTSLPAAVATASPTTSQPSHAAEASQAVAGLMGSALGVSGLNPTKSSEIPAGATVVTETVSDKPLVVTYAPSKATVDVTSTTTDKDGHIGVTVIPKGGWIWALSGPPPSGGPPPLPGPPGGVAAPKDPNDPEDPQDPKDPKDPNNPNDKEDPDDKRSSIVSSTPSATVSSTPSSTVSSGTSSTVSSGTSSTVSSGTSSTVSSGTSSTSSAVSCNRAAVAISPNYPFEIDANGEETPVLNIVGLAFLFNDITATPVPTSTPPPSPSKTPEPSAIATSTTPPPSPSPSQSEAPKVLPAKQGIEPCKSDDDCVDHVCLEGKSTCEDLGAPEVKMAVKKICNCKDGLSG